MNAGAGTTVNVTQTTRPGTMTPLVMPTRSTAPAKPGNPVWGKMLKGALVVTAVAVVGLAIFAVATSVIPTMIAGSATASSIVGAAATGAHTVLSVGGGIINLAWNSTVGLLLPNIATALGLSTAPALLAPTAATMTASNVGAGALGVAGMTVAIKPVTQMITSAFDHSHAVNATMADDGSQHIVNNVVTTKKGLMANGNASDLPDLPDDVLQESTAMRSLHATKSASMAAKMSHHAAEDSHEHARHQQELQSLAIRNALARSANANKTWAEQVAETSARVGIKPRDASFTAQADAEKNVANDTHDQSR